MSVSYLVPSTLCALAILSFTTNSVSAQEQESLTAITRSSDGVGIPNGSSSDKTYLPWLTPTEQADYGYTQENPIEIGGFIEGMGNNWSSQYFSSLLGKNGEATHFERVKSCCSFKVKNPKILDAGITTGFLDVFEVTVDGQKPVTIYVSLYNESEIFAPKGFSTRGKRP